MSFGIGCRPWAFTAYSFTQELEPMKLSRAPRSPAFCPRHLPPPSRLLAMLTIVLDGMTYERRVSNSLPHFWH
jgi:hypothetical protein